MPAGFRFFSTERRPETIHLVESENIRLVVQLTALRQERAALIKVFRLEQGGGYGEYGQDSEGVGRQAGKKFDLCG